MTGDGQLRGDLQPSPPRLQRMHQPPRTLNILNKIVVRSPHMEQMATRMTSAESIGSCSLDVDATASESSGAADVVDGRDSSVSQHTLHSGSIVERTSSVVSAAVKSPCGPHIYSAHRTLDEPYAASLANGGVGGEVEAIQPDLDLSPRRQPSYVGISCSVSGYSSFSRYNSKAREGLPSCDASPARTTFPTLPDLVRESSALQDAAGAMGGKYYTERPSNLPNGHHVLNGFGPPDSRATRTLESSEKRRDVQSWSTSVQSHSNGDTVVEAKSLVQQRIERLYGPGALAQGFLVHRVKARAAHSVEKLLVKPESVTTCSTSTTSITCSTYISSINAQIIPPVKVSKFQLVTSAPETIPDQSRAVSSLKEANANLQYQEIRRQPLNGHQEKDPAQGEEEVDFVRLPPSVIGNNFELVVSNGCSSEPNLEASQELASGIEIKNGEYFIKVMEVEQRKIELLIAEGEAKLMSAGFSEDLSGRFRATIGKASLLLTQKFQQFRGLCEKNICQHPDDPFPTTLSDLAGFWDMVLIQVHNIYDMFRDIDLLKDNQWHQRQVTEADSMENKPVKAVNGMKSRRLGASKKSTSTTGPKTSKAEEAARAREEARKRLAEVKRKARSQLSNVHSEEQVIKIFAPDSKE